MKNIIVLGSSRIDGNSYQIAEIFKERFNAKIINLKTRKIGSYSYENENGADDFLPTMREIVEHDTIIFITPVYWYSMSGIMKNFFDRITDCLKIDKETGRKLKGKNMFAVSCGSDEIETVGFFIPFKSSAKYLGMNYLGNIHTWIEIDKPEQKVMEKIEIFVAQVKNKLVCL